MKGFWFTSNEFTVEPGEDSQTNPGCFGKSVGTWIGEELGKLSYETKVVPEDWGWCVICSSQPFLLWVGCGNAPNETSDPQNLIWHCFVEAEVPFMKRLFSRVDSKPAVEKLEVELKQLLMSDLAIHITEEP